MAPSNLQSSLQIGINTGWNSENNNCNDFAELTVLSSDIDTLKQDEIKEFKNSLDILDINEAVENLYIEAEAISEA